MSIAESAATPPWSKKAILAVSYGRQRINDMARHIFNVMDFGNLADVSTIHDDPPDISDFIEKALEACVSSGGGVVVYPAGIYGISKTISHGGGVPILNLGHGKDQTVIKAIASSTNPQDPPPAFNMFQVGYGTGSYVFANMTVDGNKDSFSPPPDHTQGNGISFDSRGEPSHGNGVRRVRFCNHYSCGVITFGDDSEKYNREGNKDHEINVEHCSFEAIELRAAFLRYVTGGGVSNCDINFTHGTDAAINVYGSKNFTITRNIINVERDEDEPDQDIILTNGNTGINVVACDDYSIIANIVSDVANIGIVASGGINGKSNYHPPKVLMSRRFICAANIVSRAGGAGIVVDVHYPGCTRPEEQWGIIANNEVRRTRTNNGIIVQASKQILITDNTVEDAKLFGISLNSSSYCTALRNTVTNAGWQAFGINKMPGYSSVGCHYIGDDNTAEGRGGAIQPYGPEENTRLGGIELDMPCHKQFGASIIEVVGNNYVVEDKYRKRERVYICQRLADGTYDWLSIPLRKKTKKVFLGTTISELFNAALKRLSRFWQS